MLFLTWVLDGVDGQHHHPVTLPQGRKTSTHVTVGWLGLGGRSGRVRKNPAPTGVRAPNRPAH